MFIIINTNPISVELQREEKERRVQQRLTDGDIRKDELLLLLFTKSIPFAYHLLRLSFCEDEGL